jgi:hypothetical protein
MISDISQKSVEQIARNLRLDAPAGQRWSTSPWYQRDQVWDKKRKKKLIDSLKKGMPFGMVWTWTHVVDGVAVTDIIDGKQRCTTLSAFMNDDFRDEDGFLWSEWSESERVRAENQHVAVQGVTLNDDETESTIVELFRRINTQSKQLSPGQLLKSCEKEDTMQFIMKVFFEENDENSLFANEIEIFRNKWAHVFCKTEFKIKETSSHSELTFLAGMVVPLLTGKNEAITSSFEILLENGLQDTISYENKVMFFEKMNSDDGFLDIAMRGWEENQFKKSAKGFPTLGKITPFIYIVNKTYIVHTSPDDAGCDARKCMELIPLLNEFFEKLDDDEDIKTAWEIRLRKNRNIETLREDVEFIWNTITDE